MKLLFCILTALFIFSGCLSVDLYAKKQLGFVNSTDAVYPGRPAGYPVELFFGNSLPEKKYEIIGEISGQVTDDIKPVLTARIRQVGGDGAIDIKISHEIESKPASLKVEPGVLQGEELPVYSPGYAERLSNIKCKVIRYK